jgi:hypothetical protein
LIFEKNLTSNERRSLLSSFGFYKKKANSKSKKANMVGQWGGKRTGAGRKKNTSAVVLPVDVSLPRQTRLQLDTQQQRHQQQQQQLEEDEEPFLECQEQLTEATETRTATTTTTTTTTATATIENKVRGRHGGFRPGAGRKKGSITKNKRKKKNHVVVTQEQQQVYSLQLQRIAAQRAAAAATAATAAAGDHHRVGTKISETTPVQNSGQQQQQKPAQQQSVHVPQPPLLLQESAAARKAIAASFVARGDTGMDGGAGDSEAACVHLGELFNPTELQDLLNDTHHDDDGSVMSSATSNLDLAGAVQPQPLVERTETTTTTATAASAATAAAKKEPTTGGIVVNKNHHQHIRCFYWPCCTSPVSVCGGRRRNSCQMVNGGIVALPVNFEAVKKRANRKYKAKLAAARYTAMRNNAKKSSQEKFRNGAVSVPIVTTTAAAALNNNAPPSPNCEPCTTTATQTREGSIGHELDRNSAVVAKKPPPPRLDAIQEPTLVVGTAAVTAEPTETSTTAAAAAAAVAVAAGYYDDDDDNSVAVSHRCFYWPCCPNEVAVCGGRHRSTCKLVKSGSIVLPLDFEQAKKRAKAEYEAKRYAARRKAAATATTASTTIRVFKCFYWPCCTKDASVCGGKRRDKCRMVNSGSVQLPPNFEEVKRTAKLKEDAQYSAERYAKRQKAKRQLQTSDREKEESRNEPVCNESQATPSTPAEMAVVEKVPQLNDDGPDGLADEPCNTTGLLQESIEHEHEHEVATNSPPEPKASPPAVQPQVDTKTADTDVAYDGHSLDDQQQHPQSEARQDNAASGGGNKQAGAERKRNAISTPVATPEQAFAQPKDSLPKSDSRNVASRSSPLETEPKRQEQRQFGPQLEATIVKKRKCGHGGKRLGAGRKRKKIVDQVSARKQTFEQKEVVYGSSGFGSQTPEAEQPQKPEIVEQASAPEQTCQPQEGVDGSSCVDSQTLETEQPQKPEPQFVKTLTKTSVCGHGGKRAGTGRKRKRIAEQASAPGQTISEQQQQQHSVQVENPDLSRGDDVHMLDVEQQQEQQFEPLLATTGELTVGCGHGGKGVGAERKKMQLDGPLSPIEQTTAQHQASSLLHPASSSTECAVDPPGAEDQLRPQEFEELSSEVPAADGLTEPVIGSEMQGESETTNTVDAAMTLYGTVLETQRKADNVTMETILPLNDSNQAGMDAAVEKATTLNDPNRSMPARLPETLKPNGELSVDTTGQLSRTREPVKPAATAPESPSKNDTTTVILQKKCVYWPCCTNDASVCGGHHRNACMAVRSGRVVLPSNFQDVKLAANREVKRKYSAWLRAAAKDPKQKSKWQRYAQPRHHNNMMNYVGQVVGHSSATFEATVRHDDTLHQRATGGSTERGVHADPLAAEQQQADDQPTPPMGSDGHVLEPATVKPPQEMREHELTMAPNSVGFHDKVDQPAMAATAATKSPFENVTNPTTATILFRKRCFYWPFCMENASVCGGHHRNACQAVESGRAQLPSNFEEVKKSATREAKAKYAAERRAAKKRQKKKSKKKVTRR